MTLPEITSAGIYDSALRAKNLKVSKNRKTTMFEIELPLDSGGVSYVDSSAHAVTPELIICAKPGQTRHSRFPFRCYFVHLRVSEGPLRDVLLSMPDFFLTRHRTEYLALFKELIGCYNALNAADELLLQSLVLRLIYLLKRDQRQAFSSSATPVPSDAVDRAIAFIGEDLTRDLTLESVARAVSLSPVHFHGLFKRSVGVTLREYVEERRLKKAIGLLLTTDLDLTRIAYECGFSSQSYFSFVFKRKMNVTPREYVRSVFAQYEE